MWKNTYNQYLSPSFLKGMVYKEEKKISDPIDNSSYLKSALTPVPQKTNELRDPSYSERLFFLSKLEAEEGLSEIRDPLWYRICKDIFQTLGPVAFKNLWKTRLIGISADGKRAFLDCPDKSVAMDLERYHFVIISAVKKFYPFVTSIETQISSVEEEYCFGSTH